jgi:hypothetical protein
VLLPFFIRVIKVLLPFFTRVIKVLLPFFKLCLHVMLDSHSRSCKSLSFLINS